MGYIGSGPTRFNTADELTVTGDAEFNGNLTVKGTTTTIDSASVQTVDLGDNDKIRLGDGDDLQIYHDGSNSYIQDVGTGNLFIQGESAVYIRDNAGAAMAVFNDGGAVQLRYNGLEKLATTSTGVDVTGAISSNKGSAGTLATFTDGVNSNFVIETASLITTVGNTGGSTALAFKSSNTERMRIDSSGNVGIGTSSPTKKISADIGLTATDGLALEYAGDNKGGILLKPQPGEIRMGAFNSSGTYFTTLYSNNSEAARIDSSGNVGIGTSSPARRLTLHNSSATTSHIQMTNATTGEAGANGVLFGVNSNGEVELWNYESTSMLFAIGGTERMRITAAGDICFNNSVANTASGYSNQQGGGFVASDKHFEFATNVDRSAVEIGKNHGNDGDIVTFRKQGTTVGSVGTQGSAMTIGNGATGLRFSGAGYVHPHNISTNLASDDTIDLGASSARFDDVYATNGTIQTSDANEKQQIAALTDAEITAAKAISALFKTFKWNSAVTEKGDAARTHAGVIAQDVQAAMTAAGLDAGDYAFFISSTWWETQTEVPAVEAVEAVDAVYEDVLIPAVEEELDEDGNVIVEAQPERTEQRLVSEAIEAVEAVDAYTRTDTYETAEEAPEGATERTRMGIRYPELLAFVGAATEQRLANIETRLTALETA